MAIERNYRTFDDTMPFIFEVENTLLEMYLYKEVKDNVKEQVINFHRDYLFLSHKWKIGMQISSKDYVTDNLRYWGKFENLLRKYFREKNLIEFSFSGVHEDKMVYGPTYSRIYFENTYRDVYDLKGLKTDFDLIYYSAPHIPIFEIFGSGYNESIIDESQECIVDDRVMFSFGLASDCFFPYLFRDEEVIDNRIVAHKNIPRYNSFLRDLKNLGHLHKMKLKIECENGGFEARNVNETPDGILINGKIIYQEDIDEGRISLDELISI